MQVQPQEYTLMPMPATVFDRITYSIDQKHWGHNDTNETYPKLIYRYILDAYDIILADDSLWNVLESTTVWLIIYTIPPYTVASSHGTQSPWCKLYHHCMGLFPDTYICGLRMCRECRERFPRHRGLAIPTCITARAQRTCHVACRDR